MSKNAIQLTRLRRLKSASARHEPADLPRTLRHRGPVPRGPDVHVPRSQSLFGTLAGRAGSAARSVAMPATASCAVARCSSATAASVRPR